jgi:hypothetical protein
VPCLCLCRLLLSTYLTHRLAHLTEHMSAFVRMCGFAIRLSKSLISSEHIPFQVPDRLSRSSPLCLCACTKPDQHSFTFIRNRTWWRPSTCPSRRRSPSTSKNSDRSKLPPNVSARTGV